MIAALQLTRLAPYIAAVTFLGGIVGYGYVQNLRARAATAEAAKAVQAGDQLREHVTAMAHQQAIAAAAAKEHAAALNKLRARYERETRTLSDAADSCLDADMPIGVRDLFGGADKP